MKLYKKMLTLAAVSFALYSCGEQDAESFVAGSTDALESYGDIFFPKTNVSIELEPTEPTSATITLCRPTKSGALEIEMTTTGNSDIITVDNAVFADGDSVATVALNFPNATIGTTYSITITPKGTSYATPCTFSITRVKWNDVGFYYDERGNKVEGWCLFTEDFLTTFFNVGNMTYPIKVQEREDRKGYFRMVNTFGETYPYNDPDDWDDSKDYYIYLDATKANQVYIPTAYEQGTNYGYGNFICHSMAGYYLAKGDASTAAGYYGKYANGKITFPKSALLFGMSDYNEGGLYSSNANGAFCLVINPDLDPYKASIKDDFEWEEVYVGAFESKISGNNSEVSLMIGTCVNTKDDCDKVFEKEYGTLYALNDPYGADAPIFFSVKEDQIVNVVSTPQYTGMKALSEDVYAIINPKASSFSEKTITLNITFQNKKGDIVYGTTDETISNITWNLIGTGTYTFVNLFENPIPVSGFELYQREDEPNLYKINGLFSVIDENGIDMVFSMDNNNACVVANQNTGITSGYGDIWIDELSDYAGEEMSPSYFDPETSTFNFGVVYYVSAGVFGYGYETFTLDTTNTPVAAPAKVVSKSVNCNIKTQNGITRANKLVGKYVDIKSAIAKVSDVIF